MGSPDDSKAVFSVLENWLDKHYPLELVYFTINRGVEERQKGGSRGRRKGRVSRESDSKKYEVRKEFEKMYEFWSFLKKSTYSKSEDECDVDASESSDSETESDTDHSASETKDSEMESGTDYSASESSYDEMANDTDRSALEPSDVEMKSCTNRSVSEPVNGETEGVIEHSAVKRRKTSSGSASHLSADRSRKPSSRSAGHPSVDRSGKSSSNSASHPSVDRSRKSSSGSASHLSMDRCGKSSSDSVSRLSADKSRKSSSGSASHLSADRSRKSSSSFFSQSSMEREVRRYSRLEDSREKARVNFSWMTDPIDGKSFMEEYWEKKYLHIPRLNKQYYRKVFTTSELDSILRNNHVMFSKNIDVTSYVDGVRSTLNPEGRAYPSIVWDMYSTGASVRFLNPQTYSNSVWRLCEGLQDAFGCFVGANVYLTPAGTQGFAPHYDDIEAFVLQLEGKKRWRVYQPRKNEKLALTSSPNLKEEDLDEPDLDVVLEAGDLLYFPRGFIHQANALPDTHSLHITISCFQNNSWYDLLSKAIPRALSIVRDKNVSFRQGLPTNYLDYMGLVHTDTDDKRKEEMRSRLVQQAQQLFDQLKEVLPLDGAADQMGKKLIHDALPPVLRREEKVRTVFNGGEMWEDGAVVNHVEISPDTKIKLLKANVARLLVEEDEVRLYYSTENSREYHELFPEEPPYLVIERHLAPGVEFLFQSYPRYNAVSKLPLKDLTSKLDLANMLWERGIIISRDPLISGFDG